MHSTSLLPTSFIISRLLHQYPRHVKEAHTAQNVPFPDIEMIIDVEKRVECLCDRTMLPFQLSYLTFAVRLRTADSAHW